MPTAKKRVTWILSPEVIQAMNDCSHREHRPIARQADLMLREALINRGYSLHTYVSVHNSTEASS